MSTCKLTPIAAGLWLALSVSLNAYAAEQSDEKNDSAELDLVTVTASADASEEGLTPAYAGGQVATGGRAGILGNQDYMDSAFSVTSYTNELIQDRQARSVGEVLQNDPGVRVARGFGNFQESYIMRGFILNSDDIAYNGLYSILPRQYIATELFERVEVLRGASSFLTGASPSGGGIGGNINLLPKRAPNEDLNRITLATDHAEQFVTSADIARRFGEDNQFGVRVNASRRDGGTAIDGEESELGLFSVGLDWRGERARISADIGWQNNELDETRTNVSLVGVDRVPSAPDSDSNWAQPWSYSDEEDVFGTLRGEFDFTDSVTGWAAYGFRRTDEENSLANLTVGDATTGDGTTNRFDNTREDDIDTGELGLRGVFETGPVQHDWVMSAAHFNIDSRSDFAFTAFGGLNNNLYNPFASARPEFAPGTDISSPGKTFSTELESYAIGDTLSVWNDRLSVTLGLRYQRLQGVNYGPDGARTSEYDETDTTPVVGAVFKLTPAVSLYANYIESLRQGETAPLDDGGTPLVNAGEVLEPYVSEQQEIGVKFDGETLGGGIAYFMTDKPRSFIDRSDADNPVFTASGEDQHQGVELTAFGKLNENVKLLGGLTWTDARQEDTGNETLDNQRVIGVPEFQANLGTEWAIPAIEGLALDARAVYTSSMYVDAQNELKLPSWTRFDVGARYQTEFQGNELTLRARVDNLFDRDYWASASGFSSGAGDRSGYLVLGSPRTVTLSATLDF